MTIANPSIKQLSPDTALPLTEAQTGLWYFQKLDSANPILNTGQFVELEGALDIAAFEAAVMKMIDEAECLALTFEDTASGPLQQMNCAAKAVYNYVDLCSNADAEAIARADMQADTDTPADLANGPLAMFRLYRIADARYFWYERIHHLAIDGYGMVLLTNRVGELYSEAVSGKPPRAALAPYSRAVEEDVSYRHSPERDADSAFWRSYMDGVGDPASLKQGRAASGDTFHRETSSLPKGVTDRLNAFSRENGFAWPDVLTTLVAAYCLKFSGVEETTFSIPHMGRFGSSAARTPCMLMNLLPLRVRYNGGQSVVDFVRAVTADLKETRKHGRYRSEQLRRDLGMIGGHRRLFGPMINVQPFDMPPRFAGIETRLHIMGAGAVDDITFTFRGDARDGLPCEADSNPHLYSREETGEHLERLATFIEAALEADTLDAVPLATPEEMQRLTHECNQTDHDVPQTTLTALLETAFEHYAESEALRFNGDAISYAALDKRSAALAAKLVGMGAGRDTVVAVALPRSFELVIALVAILRAGAAYLPLDPANPAERLQRIVASAKPVAVLTGDELAPVFDTTPVLKPQDWPNESDLFDGVDVSPNALAYVIYTSGSTGEPKGVMIEHQSIVNRLEWMRQHYDIGSDDRIMQKTPATFDVSVWEFFLPLISGATLVIAPPDAHRDPEAIAGLIKQESVTVLHFVPSMLSAFLTSPASHGIRLRKVFCSGEELGADLRDRFHAVIDGELHNLYGPTEAAVDVSYWPASREDISQPVPIGFPVWNTQLYILDSKMWPLPAGVAGDLYLGGIQVARGYLGREDLTRERFLSDPFLPGNRIYKTGDVARRRPDGAVEFLGRSDHQVKIRGLRIELGEIESIILTSGMVREAAVIVREDRPGDKRLVAYVVPEGAFDEERLRRRIIRALPEYMLPSAFVVMDALKVTANGKLDRAALPAPVHEQASSVAPSSETEKKLALLFGEILGVEGDVGADADFFLLGGDSLLAVNLTLRIREEFGSDPGLGAIFENPVLSALAELIDQGIDATNNGLGPVIRLTQGAQSNPPLFLLHPAGGIAWGYQYLARALMPARTVYGLQSPALDLEKPLPESLDALAEQYAERIAELAPKSGPVHLAGWSVGGILAQAVAVALEQRGCEVGMVALLDAYPCECWRSEPEPDGLAALGAILLIGGHDPAEHPELTTRQDVVAFLRAGGGPLGRLPEAALDGVVRCVMDTNRLVRQHYHKAFSGALTHIRAAEDHKDGKLTSQLWEPYAHALDVEDVPFLHPQMASETAASIIAPILSDRMARFEGKNRS